MRKNSIVSRLFFHSLPGFTLVELIVVISILAVLGTIGFIGLQGYSKSSRDSNRVTSVRTLVSGLSLYVIQSGKYPSPEGAVSTGSIGGVNLVYKGEVGSNIASLIRHSDKAPKDPLANTAYAYGISADGKYYQIGATLENLEALNGDTPTLFVDTAYAASPLKARVDGNYLGYLKFLSGSETWIANIPSLIYSNTGSVSLDASNTNVHYVINGDTNLPYPVGGEIAPVPKTPDEVVKSLWKDSSATLTGVNITGVTNSNTLSSVFTGATLASFGGNIGSVEQVVLGTTGSSGGGIGVSGGASCTLSGTTVAHGATITGYSETNILYSAAYDCTSRQLSRTCSNGTLSGDASYQYVSCVKGTVNNCTANSSYTYNSHTYSLPAITHGSSATNIVSTAVSQNHGSFTYTLTNATCNDGVIGSVTENATPSVVSCESGYHIESNACVSDTKSVACGGSNPDSTAATLGTATVIIIWNGTAWNATQNWSHLSTAPGVCQYQCKAGYWYNGTTCVPSTAGYYVASAGSVSQTQCPVNNYCPLASVNPIACNMGMVSPIGSTSSSACSAACVSGAVCGSNYIAYNNPGSYTYTVPTGVTSITVYAIGGGGGGGWHSGAGGGGGGYGKKIFNVTGGQSYNLTVGAGGSVNHTSSNSNGANGGTSLFSSLISYGGSGGGGVYPGEQGCCFSSSCSNLTYISGGVGGSATGYDIGGNGGNGQDTSGNGSMSGWTGGGASGSQGQKTGGIASGLYAGNGQGVWWGSSRGVDGSPGIGGGGGGGSINEMAGGTCGYSWYGGGGGGNGLVRVEW